MKPTAWRRKTAPSLQLGFAAEPLIIKSPSLKHQRDADEGRRGRLVEPPASASASPIGLDLEIWKMSEINTGASGGGAEATNVVVATPAAAPLEMAGTVEYQGDAGRIQQWFADQKTPPDWKVLPDNPRSVVSQQKRRRRAWHNHRRT